MSASTARDLGITNWNVSNGALNGSMVNITVNGTTLNNVPVMIQPGQAVVPLLWQLVMVELQQGNVVMI